MIHVKATLTSIGNGMLMNQMDGATLDSLITGVRINRPKDRPLTQVAEEKMYRDADGKIGIPTENLLACLVEAGRLVKNGARAISTKEDTKLYSFLNIEATFLPFTEHSEMRVDRRRGVLNTTGKSVAVGIVRPRFDSWTLQVSCEIDERVCGETTVQELFRQAGLTVGLCDFRPSKRGPFGRFKVASWVRLDADQQNAAQAGVNGRGSRAASRQLVGAK